MQWVSPAPSHGVMLSKIWQIGALANLTDLIFHAKAVGWDTSGVVCWVVFFFFFLVFV